MLLVSYSRTLLRWFGNDLSQPDQSASSTESAADGNGPLTEAEKTILISRTRETQALCMRSSRASARSCIYVNACYRLQAIPVGEFPSGTVRNIRKWLPSNRFRDLEHSGSI